MGLAHYGIEGEGLFQRLRGGSQTAILIAGES